MVAHENRIFIFGGSDRVGVPSMPSFSVAHYINRGWKWVIVDRPYPDHIQAIHLGFGGAAIPVYNGQKILLTGGYAHEETVSGIMCESLII